MSSRSGMGLHAMLDNDIIRWIAIAMASIVAIGSAWKALKMLLIDIIASAPLNKQLLEFRNEFKHELNQGLASIRSMVDLHEQKLRHEFDEKNHLTHTTISNRIDTIVRDYNELDKLYIRKFAEMETDLHHTKNYQREIMDRIDRFEREIKDLLSEHGKKVDEFMKMSTRSGIA